MRRILFVLLALATFPARAEWEAVSEGIDAVFYVDPATISKNGDLRRVWTLHDAKKRGPSSELWMRTMEEIDCTLQRSRAIAISIHADQMARGRVIAAHTLITSEWTSIAPDTNGFLILKSVCEK